MDATDTIAARTGSLGHRLCLRHHDALLIVDRQATRPPAPGPHTSNALLAKTSREFLRGLKREPLIPSQSAALRR